MIEYLIDNGANINILNENGRCPIDYTSAHSDIEKYLLDNGSFPQNYNFKRKRT